MHFCIVSLSSFFISITMPHLFPTRAFGFFESCAASNGPGRKTSIAAMPPNPITAEAPAIFKNCLLLILMSDPPPSARYDNPSSKVLQPHNYDIYHRNLSYSNGTSCMYWKDL